MVKRFALYFGAAGYILPVWNYAFNFDPFNSGLPGQLLYASCVFCPEVFPGPGAKGTLLFIAPINALLYAVLGYVVAKLVRLAYRHRRAAGSAEFHAF